MSDDVLDWFDVALRPLSKEDGARLLAEFQVTVDAVDAGASSWHDVANSAAHWSARAVVEGDMAGAWFWAHATREFSDRQSILEMTSPKPSQA